MRLLRFDLASPTKAQRAAFSCGIPSLDRWLATQARQSLASRDAVTYLLLDEEQDPAIIAGYFCLSAGSASRGEVSGALARRAPEPVPLIRMGRFAIDQDYQGQGWGTDLLQHAIRSALAAGSLIGARAIVVDAIDDRAAAFYELHGFSRSPSDSLQLLHDLRTIAG